MKEISPRRCQEAKELGEAAQHQRTCIPMVVAPGFDLDTRRDVE